MRKVLLKIASKFNDHACKYYSTHSAGAEYILGGKVQNLSQDRSKILIGRNSKVGGELLVFAYGGKITIGDNCYVGLDSRIWSGEDIFIGNNVLISHQVNIIDTNSHELDHLERAAGYKKLISSGHPKEKGSIATAPIFIGDYVWISFGVSILKGVSIGKGAIISAGSVVTEDVPPFTKYICKSFNKTENKES